MFLDYPLLYVKWTGTQWPVTNRLWKKWYDWSPMIHLIIYWVICGLKKYQLSFSFCGDAYLMYHDNWNSNVLLGDRCYWTKLWELESGTSTLCKRRAVCIFKQWINTDWSFSIYQKTISNLLNELVWVININRDFLPWWNVTRKKNSE